MSFSAMIEGLTRRLEELEVRIRIVAWGQAIEIIGGGGLGEEDAGWLHEMVKDRYLDKGKYSFEDLRKAVDGLSIDKREIDEFDKKRLQDLLSFLSTP